MKHCPNCKRTYSDDSFTYCLDDGGVLTPNDPNATLRMSEQSKNQKGSTTLVGAPDQIYTSFPNPLPTTNQTQNQPTRWLLYVSLAALVVFLGVVVSVLVWFETRVPPEDEGARHQLSTEVQPRVSPSLQAVAPSPTPASFTDKDLLGVWRTVVNEQGNRTEISVAFLQDGSTRYQFTDSQGKTSGYGASWRYSDGVLYERYANGKSGRDSIRWIDRDEFELTIIDNGTGSYAGKKRLYHRVISEL